MSYLSRRRLVELAAMDRPWLADVLTPARRKRYEPSPAERWDAMYRSGEYDRLTVGNLRHHHRLLAALIAERKPKARILEVGCGEAMFYEALRPFEPGRYRGIDLSSVAIEAAGERHAADVAGGRAEFQVSDGADFEDEARFDAVIFADVLDYLGEPEAVIDRYAGLLSPGGLVGLTLWTGLPRIHLWARAVGKRRKLDEAVVSIPSGGAWIVTVFEP